MTDPIRAAGKHPFEYQAPTEVQTELIKELRQAFRNLHDTITMTIPSSRERSLAITKMEEANMWLNKAIVFTAENGIGPSN